MAQGMLSEYLQAQNQPDIEPQVQLLLDEGAQAAGSANFEELKKQSPDMADALLRDLIKRIDEGVFGDLLQPPEPEILI